MKFFIRFSAWFIAVINASILLLFVAKQIPEHHSFTHGFYLINLYSMFIVLAIAWQETLITNRLVNYTSFAITVLSGITFAVFERNSEFKIEQVIPPINDLIVLLLVGFGLFCAVYTFIAALFEEDYKKEIYNRLMVRVNRLPSGVHFNEFIINAKTMDYYKTSISDIRVLHQDLDKMQRMTDHMVKIAKH